METVTRLLSDIIICSHRLQSIAFENHNGMIDISVVLKAMDNKYELISSDTLIGDCLFTLVITSHYT